MDPLAGIKADPAVSVFEMRAHKVSVPARPTTYIQFPMFLSDVNLSYADISVMAVEGLVSLLCILRWGPVLICSDEQIAADSVKVVHHFVLAGCYGATEADCSLGSLFMIWSVAVVRNKKCRFVCE